MHKPSHVRTKSDHILKAKPAINFMKPSKVKLGSSGVKKPKKATDKPPKDKLYAFSFFC